MTQQNEINQIGFTIQPLIKKLCDDNIVTQSEISRVLAVSRQRFNFWINSKHKRYGASVMLLHRNKDALCEFVLNKINSLGIEITEKIIYKFILFEIIKELEKIK